jgi:pyruvate carboxylase
MYPKVFTDYAKEKSQFSDVSVLPTPAFFYGLSTGDEVDISIERGKTLFVRFVATSDVHEDGTRTVFYELNGQPRSVRVADRNQVARKAPTRKADSGDTSQVGAPMPGNVVTVSVKAGQKVHGGDTLITLEAMKMEAAVRAERDAEVVEVLVRPGQHVDAKDLLVILK